MGYFSAPALAAKGCEHTGNLGWQTSVFNGDDGPAEGENVIDLMGALKESLKEAGGKSSAKRKAPRKKAS